MKQPRSSPGAADLSFSGEYKTLTAKIRHQFLKFLTQPYNNIFKMFIFQIVSAQEKPTFVVTAEFPTHTWLQDDAFSTL